ncbi:hypothetical protein LCGC14_0555890 [marine sediment metagenome]|uniref:SCP2 domain-containing protein n=1 Tax=marine sediment metagenome TaxID=412755 RepID=A0A0F9UWQ9_9ZZZZ
MNAETAVKTFRQIKDGKLFGEDLETFLEVLKYFTNKSEYAEEELYGWEKIVQVKLRDAKDFYLKTNNPFTEHPKLDIKYGNVHSPDTTIISDVDTFTGIMCGRAQRFTEGSMLFRIEGDGTQASIFFMLIRLIAQEFTEQKRQGLMKK